MLTDVLEEAGLDPTAIIGSLRSKTGSNFRAGKSKYAVVEACEYRRDFLHLKPEMLIITNIEHEHVDYYKDLADVQDAFRTLACTVPETGYIITDTTSPAIKPVLEGVVAKVIDYRQFLDISLSLHQPGMHNRLNAAAALAAARTLGVDGEEGKTALENFAGTWRRFEYKGTFVNEGGAIPVFDDYGHHPTEVTATILGTREQYPNRHLTVVFQSHTYSRTHELFADFVTALAKADAVYLLPIYAAREENTYGVTSEQLCEKLVEAGVVSEVFHTHGGAAEVVRARTPQGGVVVVMGAGDVTEVATLLTK
jgi:UDP-N-acetylmuramate--alanine ligase